MKFYKAIQPQKKELGHQLLLRMPICCERKKNGEHTYGRRRTKRCICLRISPAAEERPEKKSFWGVDES